ncbi:MAG: hypothetical protein AAGI22_24145 [Planctomycetota bacterium]
MAAIQADAIDVPSAQANNASSLSEVSRRRQRIATITDPLVVALTP